MIAARALEAGANGYVLKDAAPDELIKAFEKVRAGAPYLSNDMAVEVAWPAAARCAIRSPSSRRASARRSRC
jgi:DNA-binding NarL/FixJ family response regulator